MESWFLIALLSLALLIAVVLLVHHVRLVRALKQLLRRLLTLWSKQHAPPDPDFCDLPRDDLGLPRKRP